MKSALKILVESLKTQFGRY